MKISLNTLKKYIDLPDSLAESKELFEDIGLEVKRIDKEGDDNLITFELLANRGDHHSYEGVAREVSGRTGFPLKPIPMGKMSYTDNSSLFSIDTDGCIAYSATEFRNDNPADVKNLGSEYSHMLKTGGVNEICPVIDVTNVVNLELGQPAHVYDADKIKGKIHIRESRQGEKASLLFGKGEIELPAGIIVIADNEKILTLAGIMGCDVASVDENTKRVIFEAALFDPVRIRKASKALGIQTLASQRFERGGDLDVIKRSVERAALLYDQIGWKNVVPSQFNQKVALPNRTLSLTPAGASEYLDRELSKEEIIDRLSRYGFKATVQDDGSLQFKVPMHRIWDVEYPVDLYEELGKSIGYNSLPNELPNATIGTTATEAEKRKDAIDDYLVDQGFYEIFTDSLYSTQHYERMGVTPPDPLAAHVGITNAQDKGYSMLKNNCLIQAVETVEKNLRVKNRDVKAYEWTRVFHPDKTAENGVCTEEKILWGIVNGCAYPRHFSYEDIQATPLYLKGIVSGISGKLDVDFDYQSKIDEAQEPVAKLLHPLRRASILDATGRVIGIFGEIHPKVLFACGIKNERPCYFQFYTDKLLNLPVSEHEFRDPSELMPVNRDICLEVPEQYPAGSVITDIKKEKDVPVSRVELTDVYKDDKSPDRKITYSIDYQPSVANLPAEEFNKWTSAIKAKMEEKIRSR